MTGNTVTPHSNLRKLAVQIAAAYVSNNHVASADLPALIASVHATLNDAVGGAHAAPAEQIEKPTPAQIRKSITPDALISFIDGKSYKTLRRHLSVHGFTPDAYRQRYGLPADYLLVAQSYSERRSQLAIDLKLGSRKASAETAGTAETGAGAPKKGGRKKAT